METVSNLANTATAAATKMLYGDKTTEHNETGGQEPISGQQGKGTAEEPYDQGNKANPTEVPVSYTSDNPTVTTEKPHMSSYTPGTDDKPSTSSHTGSGTQENPISISDDEPKASAASHSLPFTDNKNTFTGEKHTSTDKTPLSSDTHTSSEKTPFSSGTHTSSDKNPFSSDKHTSSSDKNPFTSGTHTSSDKNPFTSGTHTSSDKNPFSGDTHTSGDQNPLSGGTHTSSDKNPFTSDKDTSSSDHTALTGDKPTYSSDRTTASNDGQAPPRLPKTSENAASGGLPSLGQDSGMPGIVNKLPTSATSGGMTNPGDAAGLSGAAPPGPVSSDTSAAKDQQGAEKPTDAPKGQQENAIKESTLSAEELLKKRDPNDHSGEPMHMHDGGDKGILGGQDNASTSSKGPMSGVSAVPATQEERRNSKIGMPGGQEHGKEYGTGDRWEKTSGLAAEGGDFDATKPGAGREADRLMAQKGIHKTAPGEHPTPGGPSHETDTKEKVSMGEKIKNKLHIGSHK